MTGDDARRIVSDATEVTLDYKRLLRERVEQSGDMEATARWATLAGSVPVSPVTISLPVRSAQILS